MNMYLKRSALCAAAFLFFGEFAIASQPRIENASECSEKMGSGGNYYSESTGKLSGKCEGDGLAPVIEDGLIVFSVPSKSSEAIPISHIKDRSELAFTAKKIKYDTSYVLDFKVQIDPKADVTNDFFYVMQVWQSPEYAPIFGLRVDRGTKSRGAFVIRNEQDSVAGKRLIRTDLSSSLKHYRVYMNIGEGLNSRIKIYEDSKVITNWSGKMGYPRETSSNNPDSLVLKFGLYKGSEPDKNFKVYFKDVTLMEMDSSNF